MVPSFFFFKCRDKPRYGSVARRRAAVCRDDSSGRVGNYRWVAWEELPHAGSLGVRAGAKRARQRLQRCLAFLRHRPLSARTFASHVLCVLKNQVHPGSIVPELPWTAYALPPLKIASV